jgi:hypothetical protein
MLLKAAYDTRSFFASGRRLRMLNNMPETRDKRRRAARITGPSPESRSTISRYAHRRSFARKDQPRPLHRRAAPDGFHSLATVYQTLELYDLVTVTARPAAATALRLTSNDSRVPTDEHNTAWKMVALALEALGLTAEVEIHIEKRLPVQGGLGAGRPMPWPRWWGWRRSRNRPEFGCPRPGPQVPRIWGPGIAGKQSAWKLPPKSAPMCRCFSSAERFWASIAASRSIPCRTLSRSGAWWPRRRWASRPRRPFATGTPSAPPRV